MAKLLANKTLTLTRASNLLKSLSPISRRFESSAAATETEQSDDSPPSSSESKSPEKKDDPAVMLKSKGLSASMPVSSMTGSIVGKRFYKAITIRESEDRNGWHVMLDYRTLKTPMKKQLKLPNILLAKAIAAEWEYQEKDGIRPFTMPIMKLACTALERIPITRLKVIKELISKVNKDLVFSRADDKDEWQRDIYEKQVEKLDPLLKWVESEFGCKVVAYTSLFGVKQDASLAKALEEALKKTENYELTFVDSVVASSHSLIIAIAMLRGRLQIEEAIELIRLEEDLQVGRYGLVEGGHDIDIADIKVQISSACVFLNLSRET